MLNRRRIPCLTFALCWLLLLVPQLKAQASEPAGLVPSPKSMSVEVGAPNQETRKVSHQIAEEPALELARWIMSLNSLEAKLIQRIYANGALLEESRGSFSMAPPLLLWHIREPFPQILLLDETRLQIYDEDLAQLTIQPLPNSVGQMPADLLMQPQQLVNGDYTVTHQIHGLDHTYRLTPSASSSLFQALDIVLTDGVLAALVIYDWQGQETRLLFDEVAVNEPLPPTRFQLVVPEGTDVING